MARILFVLLLKAVSAAAEIRINAPICRDHFLYVEILLRTWAGVFMKHVVLLTQPPKSFANAVGRWLKGYAGTFALDDT